MGNSLNLKERSRAYPAITLSDALTRITRLSDNLGINGQYNRETVATGMGYGSLSGKASRAVAALAHFGLLVRNKELYSFSALSRKYLLPNDDEDQAVAARAAALTPKLFAEIYQTFKGQVIPKQFSNRLINGFGIQPKAAPEVERIFRATMTTAGLLQPNNILDDAKPVVALEDDTTTNRVDGQSIPLPQQPSNRASLEESDGYLTVKLPSGLVIGYEQGLASAFAFGTFGQKLKELDDAVSAYKESNGYNSREARNE